ncbi:MAG TPA: FIST N-terminal domain-containing protein [Candidatus Thermoplasmatota archaeon]|nr:FIST N-terminal domain-containing protein [Candidatus Thermoplasmatota archaeon]
MRVEQMSWIEGGRWTRPPVALRADLVLAFGGTAAMADPKHAMELRRAYPGALVIGCSTAGEIQATHLGDDGFVTTAVQFEQTPVRAATVDLAKGDDSTGAGRRLAAALPAPGLVHVLVLSDGHAVNGSDLARGLQDALGRGVAVTGGLAGDGTRFAHTFVLADAEPREGRVAAIGFYGDRIRIGYGSLGGWDPFGPQRIITRAKGNVLYELDGQPALGLYKKYLGEHAGGLPATGLLFPLAVRTDGGSELTRTLLGIDESAQSLVFAGDVPQGATARLMKANFDRLVDGAQGAAEGASLREPADLAILISCVGRKLVLKQRVQEELEAVQAVLGPQAVMAGFYSYGEICPSAPDASCELHNQTMTVTTFREA